MKLLLGWKINLKLKKKGTENIIYVTCDINYFPSPIFRHKKFFRKKRLKFLNYGNPKARVS